MFLIWKGLGWTALLWFFVPAFALAIFDLDRYGLAWVITLGGATALTWFLGKKLMVEGNRAHTCFFVPYRFTPALFVPFLGLIALVATDAKPMEIVVVNQDLPEAQGSFAIQIANNIRRDKPTFTSTNVFAGSWSEGAKQVHTLELFRGQGFCLDIRFDAVIAGKAQFLTMDESTQKSCYSVHELKGVKALRLTFKQRAEGTIRVTTKMAPKGSTS